MIGKWQKTNVGDGSTTIIASCVERKWTFVNGMKETIVADGKTKMKALREKEGAQMGRWHRFVERWRGGDNDERIADVEEARICISHGMDDRWRW